MLHLSLRYRTPRIKPIGEIFEHHGGQFKHVTREQSRYYFNDIEIPIADDWKIPSELGIKDDDKLYWYPAVMEEEPPIVLSDDDEGEEAIEVEVPNPPGAVPNPPGAALATGVYECIDEYCRISEEAEQYLSEVDCYRKMIRIDIEDYADGEIWQ